MEIWEQPSRRVWILKGSYVVVEMTCFWGQKKLVGVVYIDFFFSSFIIFNEHYDLWHYFLSHFFMVLVIQCVNVKKKKGKQRRIDKGFLRVSFKRKLRYSKYKLGSFFWVEYPFSSNYQNKYPFWYYNNVSCIGHNKYRCTCYKLGHVYFLYIPGNQKQIWKKLQ